MDHAPVPAYAGALCRLALENGAAHAVPFVLENIVFDERVLIKCMFGCPDWGKFHTCPSRPGYPSMEQWRRMLERYRWGVILHAYDVRDAQAASLALERQAMRDGYYMAFSTSDCNLCDHCAGESGAPCRHPESARPSFHAVGIDVIKTARILGIAPSEAEKQHLNWYAAVWVE